MDSSFADELYHVLGALLQSRVFTNTVEVFMLRDGIRIAADTDRGKLLPLTVTISDPRGRTCLRLEISGLRTNKEYAERTADLYNNLFRNLQQLRQDAPAELPEVQHVLAR